MVVCDSTASNLLFLFEKLMHAKVPSTQAEINEGISPKGKGVLQAVYLGFGLVLYSV